VAPLPINAKLATVSPVRVASKPAPFRRLLSLLFCRTTVGDRYSLSADSSVITSRRSAPSALRHGPPLIVRWLARPGPCQQRQVTLTNSRVGEVPCAAPALDTWLICGWGSISLEARHRRPSTEVLSLESLGHTGKEGTDCRLGDVVQQRPVELPSELAERRFIEGKERDTAAVRVQREELHLAFEHREERRQPTRLPRHRHDHGDPEVTRWTVCHAD